MLEGLPRRRHRADKPQIFKKKSRGEIEKATEVKMVLRLDKNDIATLISLVSREIDRVAESERKRGFEISTFPQGLVDIRNKLLPMLADTNPLSNLSNEELPEFRQYARRKYRAELDEDLITMIEDLIERQRQRVTT